MATYWWHFTRMFITNCDISSVLLTIHRSCTIRLPLKVVHDWMRISKPACDRVFAYGVNYKKLQVSACFEGAIWDNIREFTQIIQTFFILQIKWRNSIILEPRIRQLKTSPAYPSDQFANSKRRPHLPIYSNISDSYCCIL